MQITLIDLIYGVAPALEGQFVPCLDGSIHQVGNKSISSGAQSLTLQKCFLHPSLVYFSFSQAHR